MKITGLSVKESACYFERREAFPRFKCADHRLYKTRAIGSGTGFIFCWHWAETFSDHTL